MSATFSHRRHVRNTSVAFLLWVAGLACGQAQDTTKTFGYQNGRSWASMSESMKLGFVVGCGEGLAFAEMRKFGEQFPSKSTNGEIVKGLDKFYDEPANAPIPIVGALGVFAAQVRGASASEITEMIESLRRVATSKNAERPTTGKQ